MIFRLLRSKCMELNNNWRWKEYHLCLFPFLTLSFLEASLPTLVAMHPGFTTSGPLSPTVWPFLVDVTSTRQGIPCAQSPPTRLGLVLLRLLVYDAHFILCASALVCYNSTPVCFELAPTWSQTQLQRRNSPWCPCLFRPFCRIHLLGTRFVLFPFNWEI